MFPQPRAPREGASDSCPVTVCFAFSCAAAGGRDLFIYITHDDVPLVCDRLCTCVTKTNRIHDEMANEEVIGPRKTVIVLVIVGACFAVLYPRILAPAIWGSVEVKPNKFDREAGCCEVLFESEVAHLEIINEVCSSAFGKDGNSPHSAAECRESVNATCGVDIAAFLKRSENVGKTTKMLLDIMRSSNSSCLRENFGVPTWSIGTHVPISFWTMQDDHLKQERPPIRGAAPHPAFRERGRAIPVGVPTTPARASVTLPPHVRVKSPLSGYFKQPPPIPGMRPPLGAGVGPVPAPKSSMNVFMPIYTICIIIFFVYTLSKILFKRNGEVVPPDPRFRRRVFRDDSRTTPDTKFVVTAISGLVAEVQQQMEEGYMNNQQRVQDARDDSNGPYTNGISNVAPVRIVATEYRDTPKITEESDQVTDPKESGVTQLDDKETPVKELLKTVNSEEVEVTELDNKITDHAVVDNSEALTQLEDRDVKTITSDDSKELDDIAQIEDKDDSVYEVNKTNIEKKEKEEVIEKDVLEGNEKINKWLNETELETADDKFDELFNYSNGDIKADIKEETSNLLDNEKVVDEDLEDKSTPDLLAEALQEDSVEDEEYSEDEDMEIEMEFDDKPTVKHAAEEVKSIFLETDIPQQSRVLVTDFADRTDEGSNERHSPLVVSGKMTLSLIQDMPRKTPEREESTVDDFTTASALTQPASTQEQNKEELSESEEEVEVEEIEEEIEEEEGEEDKPTDNTTRQI